MIIQGDVLQEVKKIPNNSVDVIFSDPPYALGSEIAIRPDGKVDYKHARDFMSKWEMPTGEYWEEFFKESIRVLKYGGHCLMFGMDRQLLLFKYYAHLAGLTEKQSMYWYFISSFPKSSDLSKNVDKNKGAEREVIRQEEPFGRKGRSGKGGDWHDMGVGGAKLKDITAPATDLAKKYDGYKYSIAPLKQTNETIMVFQKPYKTGSCLHDTLKMEEGDDECTCGAVDVDGNRVSTDDGLARRNNKRKEESASSYNLTKENQVLNNSDKKGGRYPSQTYCNSQAAESLDEQSGIKTMGNQQGGGKGGIWSKGNSVPVGKSYGDTAGCSKILHKCDFEREEHDLYHYVPKVSKKERQTGVEGQSNHPCMKPIALIEKILKLFKTPNPQKILIPFAGSGSEVIGAINAGFEDWTGIELNEEYCKIAEARITHWRKEKDSKLF